ncbi:hypothetical protein F5884DRAFT_786653 [Xylogone sp. PMI_703]|nr:hypothetical protein F5884DRAFT_786653 [Xylogone sp. PMI_703]
MAATVLPTTAALADHKPLRMASMTRNRAGDSIGTAFTSLSTGPAELPHQYAILKQNLSQGHENKILEGWNRLIRQLETETLPQIKELGTKLVPEVQFSEIEANGGKLPVDAEEKLKKCGTLVVRGIVPREQALEWKKDVREYISSNPSTGGFPANNIQVYETYWSKAQVAARSHPNMLAAHRAMNAVWSAQPEDPIVLSEPLSYADRLRIRTPGDKSFNLGPHLDGGSLERWEDNEYRKCYTEILKGDWENHDAFNVTPRIKANPDIHHGPGGCSIFRSYQGWLSLSDCAPGSGTLRVFPNLLASTAYLIMRPFVKLENGVWKSDNETSKFHGAAMGAGQELSAEEYPHLLAPSFVCIPAVEPGDAVFWHCDVAHMVEPEHGGTEDGSIFYLPILPLCDINVEYLRDQKASFEQGTSPPDFPGGVGESKHAGRAELDSINPAGRHAMAYGPFDVTKAKTPGEKIAYESANRILRY